MLLVTPLQLSGAIKTETSKLFLPETNISTSFIENQVGSCRTKTFNMVADYNRCVF